MMKSHGLSGCVDQESLCVMAFNTAKHDKQTLSPCLKILVVDDDELNRRMMRLLLVREGHDVQLAANGVEALQAVKDQKFDVIFMDLQMPIMGGIEASHRIREWENGGGHTLIVALTASYMPEDGNRMFEAGIDNYISKPFEVDHINRLLSLIARTELSAPPPQPCAPEATSANAEVLDVQKGIQRVGGDPRAYRELLSDFIHELPERIRGLDRLLLERDMEALARAAHNLKGVSSNLGALQLSEHADKLDKHSNEGYTDQHQALILEIKRAETALQKIASEFLTSKENIIASA